MTCHNPSAFTPLLCALWWRCDLRKITQPSESFAFGLSHGTSEICVPFTDLSICHQLPLFYHSNFAFPASFLRLLSLLHIASFYQEHRCT